MSTHGTTGQDTGPRRGDGAGYVLVVDDCVAWASTLAMCAAELAAVRVARTLADATAILRSMDAPHALIVAHPLPDGSGLDLLERARATGLDAPALILSATSFANDVNRACLLGSAVLLKTEDPASLREHVSAFVARATRCGARLRTATERFIQQHRLSARQADVVRAFMRGVPRDHLDDALGISENTVRYHVKHILAKSELMSLGVLHTRIVSTLSPEKNGGGGTNDPTPRGWDHTAGVTGTIAPRQGWIRMKRSMTTAIIAGAVALCAVALAHAQPTTPDGVSDPGPPATLPASPPTPRARRDAPDPTADHVAHHAALSAVTSATGEANRLEHARRVAAIDLHFGLP